VEWNYSYGCIRDSFALLQLPFGLKALNTNPVKSAKRNEEQGNIPVRFASVEFIPGEFVYCDEDGIVVSKEVLSI
jgi:regulator of ribonuclease activity A